MIEQYIEHVKKFGSSFNKFWEDNSIKDIVSNFNDFISNLNFEQLWAVSHIFSSVFIFICLINIMTVVYSDYLLNYLKMVLLTFLYIPSLNSIYINKQNVAYLYIGYNDYLF